MPSTVLIAAAEYLPALLDRIDMGDAAAFSDVDALRALDTAYGSSVMTGFLNATWLPPWLCR